jgi:hypothetical protein
MHTGVAKLVAAQVSKTWFPGNPWRTATTCQNMWLPSRPVRGMGERMTWNAAGSDTRSRSRRRRESVSRRRPAPRLSCGLALRKLGLGVRVPSPVLCPTIRRGGENAVGERHRVGAQPVGDVGPVTLGRACLARLVGVGDPRTHALGRLLGQIAVGLDALGGRRVGSLGSTCLGTRSRVELRADVCEAADIGLAFVTRHPRVHARCGRYVSGNVHYRR